MQIVTGKKVSIVCPKCNSVLTSPLGRVKCATCRAVLTVTPPGRFVPPARSSSSHQSLAKPIVFLGCLVFASFAISLMIAIFSGDRTQNRKPLLPAKTAFQIRMDAENAQQKALRSLFPGSVSPVIGHVWPCAPNSEDLPRLIRMIESLDDENTPDTMVNIYASALMRARAINVESRSILTVLKTQPGLRLVRVLAQKPSTLSYQRRAAEACWITSATIGASR